MRPRSSLYHSNSQDWPMEAAPPAMFHELPRIAPAPRDCAAPANYRYAKKLIIQTSLKRNKSPSSNYQNATIKTT